MNEPTNAALAEQIKGLGKLVASEFVAVRSSIDGLSKRMDVANGRTGKSEDRISAIEKRQIAATAERETLERVATQDRQHNKEVEERGWLRWQKALGVLGVVVVLLGGPEGFVWLVNHI